MALRGIRCGVAEGSLLLWVRWDPTQSGDEAEVGVGRLAGSSSGEEESPHDWVSPTLDYVESSLAPSPTNVQTLG